MSVSQPKKDCLLQESVLDFMRKDACRVAGKLAQKAVCKRYFQETMKICIQTSIEGFKANYLKMIADITSYQREQALRLKENVIMVGWRVEEPDPYCGIDNSVKVIVKFGIPK